MRTTRFVTVSLTFAAAVLASFVAAASAPSSPDAPARIMTPAAAIERGRYLVSIMGCHDCHTPWKIGADGPEPDMSRALTGHPADLTLPPAPALSAPWTWTAVATNTAFAGPWGVSFTANLTPDKETGLGDWTVDQFIATMRTRRHQGKGRPVLPPMPVQVYANMTDEDMHSVFAYLRSLPPVRNRVPQPIDPPEGAER